MATLTLSVLGRAIPGPWGFVASMVGAMVGGWIDAKTGYLGLFPNPKVEGARLGEYQFQGAGEGQGVNYCLGPENRMTGNIIWLSDLHEIVIQEENGGKGGATQSVPVYSYTADIAIGICEGPIVGILKIWADGKLIYDSNPDFEQDSNQITATHAHRTVEDSSIGLFRRTLILTSPSTGPDLSLLKSGVNVEVNGFTNPGNNGNWKCYSSSKNSTTSISTAKFDCPTASDEAAGDLIHIHQIIPKLDPIKATDIDIYLGTTVQTADPLMEATEGAGEVPAYRGLAYVVFTALQLADFGNRIPQFEFQVERDVTVTVANAIARLLQRSGLVAADYDVTGLTGNLNGLIMSGPQSPIDALTSIMMTYNIVAHESNGKLVFVMKTSLTSTTVPEADASAHELDDNTTPHPAELIEGMEEDLPSEVVVNYRDKDAHYQEGSQTERRIDAITNSSWTLNIPLVITSSIARGIARRALWTAWAARQSVQLTLPPSYFTLEENDVLGITLENESYEIIIKRVSRGRNMLVEIEGSVREAQTETMVEESDITTSEISEAYTPPALRLELMDIAAFRESEIDAVGVYFGMAPFDPLAEWRGGALYESLDDITYTEVARTPVQSILGETDGTLASGSFGIWDMLNTINIVLAYGTLSSKTAIEVLDGQNFALIGREVIGFQTATLTAPHCYTLSGLLRGRRGTESYIATHGANERFILLNQASINFRELSRSAIGSSRYYKPVAVGDVVAGVEEQEYAIGGNTLRPFAPCTIAGTRNVANDLTVTWNRRTRYLVRPFGPGLVPLGEETESYEIDFYSGAVVVRTKTATTPTVGYTAVEQTADGLTPRDPVHCHIAQMSASIGRGSEGSATV